MSQFERPNIAKMQGYTSGEQPQDGRTIKLNTNENPYPPSPQVAAALQAFASDQL
ncbi:MAG: histidinol-phosphatase, partial [Pseudomonadales bacterium]|nr:histidinol-phosphatase [Pseudomonadales bacterium]